MAVNKELIEKIKKGLIKAGFPLELNIAKKLKAEKWALSLGQYYLDFETGKHREFDIAAEKKINGIDVHLMIECKKSDKSQLVLYAPSKKNIYKDFGFTSWLKAFPSLRWKKDSKFSEKNIYKSLENLNLFSKDVSFSKNLIFTQGDKIQQDNVSFYSSLNGLIKKSIHSGGDGYNQTGFRSIFFYLVIYDGVLLQLSPSESEEFNLKEISYGQLEFDYHFKVPLAYYEIYSEDIKSFGEKYIIEIMTPAFLNKYIENITSNINSMDKKLIEGWGEDWPDINSIMGKSTHNK